MADWRAGRSESTKRKRMKTDAYVHIGTTEEYAGGMSDKDRRELECEKVRCFLLLVQDGNVRIARRATLVSLRVDVCWEGPTA